MALFVWQPEAAISGVCDADVSRICDNVKQQLPAPKPGRALECLTHSIQNQHKAGPKSDPVSADCKALVDIAEPPDEYQDFENNLQVRHLLARQACVNFVAMQ